MSVGKIVTWRHHVPTTVPQDMLDPKRSPLNRFLRFPFEDRRDALHGFLIGVVIDDIIESFIEDVFRDGMLVDIPPDSSLLSLSSVSGWSARPYE